jgi:hypothetical protein
MGRLASPLVGRVLVERILGRMALLLVRSKEEA